MDMSRDDQMFSIFLSLGNFSKKFLLVASSSSYEKYTPKAYTVSSLNFKFRMESFLWRNDPSQSISDLDWFIRKPEQFSNCRSRSKSLWTDRIFFTKTVVSSAYWVIFIDLFWSIWIPSISFERLIALLRISTPITKRIPESGQPCLTPLLRLKCFVAKPLFKTQLDMLLYKTEIHCRNWGPKLKASRHFWR